MSLTEEFVRSALKQHIFPFTKLDHNQEERHIAGIVSKFLWMENRHFPETCKLVSETMAPGRLPVPAQYIGAYRTVQDRTAVGPGETKKCSGCAGERFSFGYVRRKTDDAISQVCYPCRKCNGAVTNDQRFIDTFREQFQVSTETEFLAQRQRTHEEYLAREEARKASRPARVIDAEYKLSQVLTQAIENKKKAGHDPKPMSAALVGAETAPAPRKKFNGEEEF